MKAFAGRKLGRPTGHRFAMLRNMAASLLHHERIETTRPKAREVARFTEKIITAAKGENLAAHRAVARQVASSSVKTKLFDVLVPRYKNRAGGYTQFILKGPRLSDGAEIGILKLVT
jgi:large subunit ribosomal protein L17